MFSIHCPYCKESRDQNEFSPAGEAIFYRTNHKGDHWEQWVHTSGCRKYFLVKRSTITHEVLEVATFEEVDGEKKS